MGKEREKEAGGFMAAEKRREERKRNEGAATDHEGGKAGELMSTR